MPWHERWLSTRGVGDLDDYADARADPPAKRRKLCRSETVVESRVIILVNSHSARRAVPLRFSAREGEKG
jgi:hypothetical protein